MSEVPITCFNDVTLLITHYNRTDSLERLLTTFKSLNCSFENIVVSDDGSNKDNIKKLNKLQELFSFKLIETDINKGLGNNINKGQDAVNTEYTLYVQEDFIPKPAFLKHFNDALNIMKEDKYWDLISLYSYSPYPYLKPYKLGFSEKIFKPQLWFTDNLKFYFYGDHPHLRYSNFFKKFGRYIEGANGDKTELDMSLSFIKNKGRALFYNDHYGLLEQINSQNEPSTAVFRRTWSSESSFLYRNLKAIYLKYKFILLNIKLFMK